MNISHKSSLISSDTLIVLHPAADSLESDVQALLPADIAAHIAQVFSLGDFAGKPGQQKEIYTGNANHPRVVLIGYGEGPTVRHAKQAVGRGIIAAQGHKAKSVSLVLGGGELASDVAGQAVAVAAVTAAYAFDTYKQKDNKVSPIKSFTIVSQLAGKELAGLKKGLKRGQAIGEGINLTRQLGNVPPTEMTPTYLAKTAKAMTQKGKVSVQVFNRPEMKKMGMGCLLGVARGSSEAPKFIIVNYKGGKTGDKPTVLVGKGITFDSGGLSIKPDAYMSDMKYDMLGAATVLGTLQSAIALGLKKNIIGVVPSCENMPDGESYRPDDILTAMNGKTVEVRNTDAEGRLILSDALSYVTMKLKPKTVVDFATLTGACMVALGNERSGLFSPDNELARDLYNAGDTVGEQLWRLPLGEEYTEGVKSEVADVKNLGSVGGSERLAGASTAAAFLQEFTKDKSGKTPYPWAHIDLSCSYYGGKGLPHIRAGANGFGVETMINWLS